MSSLVYSFWADLGDLIRGFGFEAGWWSVGAWLAIAVAFAVTTAVSARSQNALAVLGLVAAGFIAPLLVGGLLQEIADPTPGCTYDCEGRAVLLGPIAEGRP